MPKIQASAPAASAEQSPVEITLTLGEGRPVDPPDLESSDRYEVVSATVFTVRTALAQMGARSPEYARLAEVADAMLMRLDTIRDENKFLARFSTAPALRAAGDHAGAAEAIKRVDALCRNWGTRHDLMLPRKGPPSQRGEGSVPCAPWERT